MSTSDFIAALPTASPAVKTLLRNSLIQRVIYPFSETEDVQTWDALDGDTGALPEAISKYGNVYALDPDDTTTVHDDATCQVTQDGYRYKVQGVALRPTSVLDKDLTTPPDISDSPPVALGDAYLVPAGATDDWAAFPDYIALRTSRGWAFEAPRIGRLVYVEDEDGYYHYDTDGDWVAGVGQNALTSSSVKVSNLLGTGRNLHFTVVNQTTNTPPSLTGSGNGYVIGSSPTGVWSGNTGKIAIDEGTAWGIYAPSEGWRIYDQDSNADYTYSGTAWVQSSGVAAMALFRLAGQNGSTISGNISSVDTSANSITWSAGHGLTTGQLIAFQTADPPAPIIQYAPYYVRAVSSSVIALYASLSDAQADTNRLDLSDAGTGTRTASVVIGITNLRLAGVSSVEIVAGQLALRLKINFTVSFPDTNYEALTASLSVNSGLSGKIPEVGMQPMTKAVGSVVYQGGWYSNAGVLTRMVWDVAFTNSDALEIQAVVMRV